MLSVMVWGEVLSGASRRGVVALALAWIFPVEASPQQSAVVTPSLVFDGVTVVDVEQGKLVPDQRVVITGNRIEAVRNMGTVKVPPGAQVVDAKGKYLIPGLWNMHTHTQRDYFDLLSIAAGVTGVRNAGSAMPIARQVQRWRAILAGARVGPPRQLLAGMPFGGAYSHRDSAIVERIVDSLKAHGANSLKMMPYSHTVAAAARRAGLPFGGHMPYLFGFAGKVPVTDVEASDSGVQFFDHWVGVDAESYFRCLDGKTGRVASVERCWPIADGLRRNGSWWVPTAFAMGNFLRTGGAERIILTRLAAFASAFWNGTPVPGNWLHDSAGSGPPVDSLGYMRIPQQVGMPIVAGLDHSNRQKPPGFYLHAELALYVAQGLTPLTALQAATLNPALLLGGTDSLGTVAPGKLADLVLLDANPLADITNTTTIRVVVANGRYFDRTALDKLLADARSRW